jgi:hypothetical protein
MMSRMPTIRARRGPTWSAEERAALVGRFRAAWLAYQAADDAGDAEAARRHHAAALAVAEEYVNAVPIVSLSRCPLTGQVFETSLDIDGLDGMWWAYEYDFRPYVEPMPTFFAWTGALKPDGPLPDWSLKAMVGPEAPFVLPRILSHPAVRAVVSSVLVGEHIGFPILYVAAPTPYDLERVDDWGHSFYVFTRPDGSVGTAHAVEDDKEKDFDLAPWLDRGKLLWIAPGDLELTLRTGSAGCPFVGLEGERRRRFLQEGETWLA